jgi:hypothetical protein
MLELELWLDEAHTAPHVSQALLLGIQEGSTTASLHTLPKEARFAFELQSDISWDLLLEGWVAYEWEIIQQEYLTAMRSRKTGMKWVEGLIRQLWKIAWRMWEHRNRILHNKENVVKSKEIRILHHCLSSLYARAKVALSVTPDRYLVKQPLKLLLKHPPSYCKERIRITEIALGSLKAQQRVRDSAHRSMRKCLYCWLNTSNGR